MDMTTIETLQKYRMGRGSLRQIARELGFEPAFAGTLSDICRERHEHVSRATEQRVRAVLGLPLLPDPVIVAPCLSCGGDHGLQGIPDCHGQPVASIVCLAPGATIRKPAPPPQRWRDYPPAELARIFTARQDYHSGPR